MEFHPITLRHPAWWSAPRTRAIHPPPQPAGSPRGPPKSNTPPSSHGPLGAPDSGGWRIGVVEEQPEKEEPMTEETMSAIAAAQPSAENLLGSEELTAVSLRQLIDAGVH